MRAPTHTPGPWRLIIDDTGGPQSGWPLVVVATDDEDKSVVRPGGQWPYEWDGAISQREAVANAHLISAAPDLLEALAYARTTIRLALIVNGDDENGSEIIKRIDAAIAKATGEPS